MLMHSSTGDYSAAAAAAQTYITAVRKSDGAALKNWMEQSETQLSDFPEVSHNMASDGVPFNGKGSVFHPETLRSILESVNVPVFDVEINTDLLHVNGPLCGIFPTALHPGSSKEQLHGVKGKISMLVPSGGAKFGVDEPVISEYQQWSALMKGWLSQKTSPDTVIVLVLPVRVNTVDSAISYSLDRRVFLLTLRRWVTTAALVEYPQRLRYQGVPADPLLIEQDESSLLVIKLSSAAKFQDVRGVQRSLRRTLRYAICSPRRRLSPCTFVLTAPLRRRIAIWNSLSSSIWWTWIPSHRYSKGWGCNLPGSTYQPRFNMDVRITTPCSTTSHHPKNLMR